MGAVLLLAASVPADQASSNLASYIELLGLVAPPALALPAADAVVGSIGGVLVLVAGTFLMFV